MMQEPLLRSFDRFEDAEATRTQLLQAGVPADAIELRVLQDEAGPVEGNFLVGNGRQPGSSTSVPATGGGGSRYAENFAKAVTRGAHLLLVNLRDEAARNHAAAILDRTQGLNVAAASSAAAGNATSG